ncbi:MAG: hypothetical protein IJL32_04470 [Oscillospiraceae bacterium]|nr:hypothetical protein [Oscillospiraceae bacterium]MBQ9905246.1 hypothetical protein [Oscillospiraceae bacterium]
MDMNKDLLVKSETVRRLPDLEQLALGSALYKKCRDNFIDSTEELIAAVKDGSIKLMIGSSAARKVKTVLMNAHLVEG